MIKIEENKPKKCTGLSSLFITFTYNPDIVAAVKSIDGSLYDPKTKTWEVPAGELARVIDTLCLIDDIELQLLKTCKTKYKQFELKGDYKLKPFDYQIDGIQYGLNVDKWLLLDEPGLGKTFQILHIAEELYLQGKIEHCLIICGVNVLKYNWANEVKKHTNLTCRILGEKVNKRGKRSIGSVDERVAQLNSKIDEFFIITNVETLREDRIVKAINNSKVNKIDMIAFDEVHVSKNPQSQQGKNLLKLTKAKYKIGATGTLLLNNPLDAYLPLAWIDVENSCMTNFKNYYCDITDKNIIVGYKHLDSLKYEIEQSSLRRRKELLNLPPKTVIREYVEMGNKQAEFYEHIKQGIIDEVDKVKMSRTNLLARVTRLRQATALPSILTSENIDSAKLVRACDLVEQIISNGDKVVVFSTFKQPIYDLAERLKKYAPLVNTGDTPDATIETNKEKFQSDPKANIFLGTWQKCGTGLTLTAATYMIFIDTPWTAAVKKQAEDRIHRIGTKSNVTIYDLITKDTIDERVAEILDDKEAISDYIIDDEVTEKGLASLQKYIEELR